MHVHFNSSISNEEKVQVWDYFLTTIENNPILQKEWNSFQTLVKMIEARENNEYPSTFSFNILVTHDPKTNNLNFGMPSEEDIYKIRDYEDLIKTIEKNEIIKANFWKFLELFRKMTK